MALGMPSCTLLFCVCMAVWGGFTRLGDKKGFDELPDLFVGMVERAAQQNKGQLVVKDHFRKQELQVLTQEVSQNIAHNGLTLDDDTLRDGNCGLDAILRCLLNLPESQQNSMIRQIIEHFNRHGRIRAL